MLERITNPKFERKVNKKDIIDKHTNGNKYENIFLKYLLTKVH